jgi:hypothetical protein
MKKFTAIILFAFILCTGSALAGIIVVGEPEPAHSWLQHWSENGMLPDQLKPYNIVIVTMLSPTTLEYVAPENTSIWFSSITETEELSGYTTQVTMTRAGSQTGEFNFATVFWGDWDEPVSFQYEVYLDNLSLSLQVASWDPSSQIWSFEYPNNCVRPKIVPEASLSILLGLGIAGVSLLGVFESSRQSRKSSRIRT